jgi:hypothetical protein
VLETESIEFVKEKSTENSIENFGLELEQGDK